MLTYPRITSVKAVNGNNTEVFSLDEAQYVHSRFHDHARTMSEAHGTTTLTTSVCVIPRPTAVIVTV